MMNEHHAKYYAKVQRRIITRVRCWKKIKYAYSEKKITFSVQKSNLTLK